MASASGNTGNFYSQNARYKVKFTVNDAGYCSGTKRVCSYSIDRGLTRSLTGYYDGWYSSGCTMTWYVDGTNMKSWEWSINWNGPDGGRWPATGDWWLDSQSGTFESSKKSGTYTVKLRTNAYGWTSNYYEIQTSLYIGDCCTTSAPTGINGYFSSGTATSLTVYGSITGWGTECGSSYSRCHEATISTKSYRDSTATVESFNSGTSTEYFYHSFSGLTPNHLYYGDVCFMNKDGTWAICRNSSDYFAFSSYTALYSPSARITSITSRGITFDWSQQMGAKYRGGTVYYCISERGSSTSVSGSNITCGSFTTSTSGSSISGSNDTWNDGFRLSPNTMYDLLVWSNNGRNSSTTRISFVTDKASTIQVLEQKDKTLNSVVLKTRRDNARYWNIDPVYTTNPYQSAEVYLSTSTNPNSNAAYGKRITYEDDVWHCRYLRFSIGGNTYANNNYMIEWEIHNTAGTDVARGKTPTGWTSAANLTNGNYNAYSYAYSSNLSTKCQIDLGTEMDIQDCVFYPYYNPTENMGSSSATVASGMRAYQNLIVEISNDGSTWEQVYNSGSNYIVSTQAECNYNVNPGQYQAQGALLGWKISPQSKPVELLYSSLLSNEQALASNTQIKPGQTYNILSNTVDKHTESGWVNNGQVEFPAMKRISSDGTVTDYRSWKITSNNQAIKLSPHIKEKGSNGNN